MLDGMQQLLEDGGSVMPALALTALAMWYGIAARAQHLFGFDTQQVVQRLAPLSALAPARREEASRLAVHGMFEALGRHRTLVHSLAFAAPMLGLLGTVSGMIETFDSLGQQAMFRQSGGIAGGIAEALLTTQLGLCIAIPGTLVGRMLDTREDRLRAGIETLVAQVVQGEEVGCAA